MAGDGVELHSSARNALEEVRCKDDDWTGKSDPGERRKRQNRLHQRAWRRRQRELRDAAGTQHSLSEEDVESPPATLSLSDKSSLLHRLARDHVSGRQRLIITDEVERPPHSSQLLWTALETIGEPQATFAYWAELMVRRKSQIATTLLLQHSSLASQLCRAGNDSRSISVQSLQNLLSLGPTLDILHNPDTWKFNFPLSADHQLFSMIQYNTLRGTMMNMSILLNSKNSPRPFQGWADFYGEGISIHCEDIPPALAPTHLQKTICHESWIDIIPSAEMRDNIIRFQDLIDADDLCADLMSAAEPDVEIEDPDSITTPDLSPELGSSFSPSPSNSTSSASPRPNSGSPTLRSLGPTRGMILWGDPWTQLGWEVDETFVRKWSFLLQGCGDLIE